MARRVFFSFHFERDHWRAGQVRNSWVTRPDRQSAGFWDAVKWEAIKKQGDAAIKQWIRTHMKGTSVTVVLVGAETYSRKYVKYEIDQSLSQGNGLLAVRIHKLKDKNGYTDSRGPNPFDRLSVQVNNEKTLLSSLYSTYDWLDDDGYAKLGIWVEKAAKAVGR